MNSDDWCGVGERESGYIVVDRLIIKQQTDPRYFCLFSHYLAAHVPVKGASIKETPCDAIDSM